jgi:hypothetical protein
MEPRIESGTFNGRLVLTAAYAEKVREVVEWSLKHRPEDWWPDGGKGKGKDAAKRALAWAVPCVEAAVLAVVGRVSAGILERMSAAVDATPEEERFQAVIFDSRADAEAWRAERPWRIAQDTAWDWPWERDEGSDICRASLAVLHEALKLCPNWDSAVEVRHGLAITDGPQAWEDADDGPPLVLRALVKAGARAFYKLHRQPAVPMTWARGFVKASSLDSRWDPLPDNTLRLRGSPRIVAAVDGRGEWFRGREMDGKQGAVVELAGVIAGFLGLEAHRQWQLGVLRPSEVYIPASRDGLTRVLKRETNPENVLEAIEWLTYIRLDGWALVNGVDELSRLPGTEGLPGRPTPYFRVEVGSPLNPWDGIDAILSKGFTLPDRFRYLSPVFDAAVIPRVGNRRTFDRQRLAGVFGLGAILVEHREDYRAQGGVERGVIQDALERDFAFYRRSQADLTDKVLDAWCAKPGQLKLGGSTGPILETVHRGGRTLLRLGPDFRAHEGLITGAADVTAYARAGGKARQAQIRDGSKR